MRAQPAVGELSSLTSALSRVSTRAPSVPSRRRVARAEEDPLVLAAADLEERLERSVDHGGFLVLRAPTNRRVELRKQLARFTSGPHAMVTVDLEAVFLDELRAEAASKRVRWERLASADVAAPGTTDHTNLRLLAGPALQRTEQRVLVAGARVVAWNPGIVRRYDDALALVDRLRATAGRADATLRTLWLVVFGSTAEARPTIDGEAVPVSGPSEWVDITDAWLENRHRHLVGAGSGGPAA